MEEYQISKLFNFLPAEVSQIIIDYTKSKPILHNYPVFQHVCKNKLKKNNHCGCLHKFAKANRIKCLTPYRI